MFRLLKAIPPSLWVGAGIATLGALFAYSTLPSGFLEHAGQLTTSGVFRNDFARRWDGGCSGWTARLAFFHFEGHLDHWIAYCVISSGLALGHPLPKNRPFFVATIILAALFIFGCGLVHLISAYTIFNPVYWFEGTALGVNGKVSILASIFICFSLEASKHRHQERLRKLSPLVEAAGLDKREVF